VHFLLKNAEPSMCKSTPSVALRRNAKKISHTTSCSFCPFPIVTLFVEPAACKTHSTPLGWVFCEFMSKEIRFDVWVSQTSDFFQWQQEEIELTDS